VSLPDGGFTMTHRSAIISTAARNNVPTVHSQSAFVRDGGLLSYGPDLTDNFRRAATYVDRIEPCLRLLVSGAVQGPGKSSV
jgi:putative ABC transport system substrate-binding protein